MGPKNTSFFLQSWRLNLGAEGPSYSVNIPGSQALFLEFCEGFIGFVPEVDKCSWCAVGEVCFADASEVLDGSLSGLAIAVAVGLDEIGV